MVKCTRRRRRSHAYIFERRFLATNGAADVLSCQLTKSFKTERWLLRIVREIGCQITWLGIKVTLTQVRLGKLRIFDWYT